jgi:tRNA (guanine-N(7)-)-methyltransferase
MAQLEPEWNFLGVEIREHNLQAANELLTESKRRNLHYMFGNINSHFQQIAQSLPKHAIRRVSILYPDPWHKKKHTKRRVVQRRLLDEIAQAILPGTELLIETDVAPLSDDMAQLVRATGWFDELPVSTTPAFKVLDECTSAKRSELLLRGVQSHRKIWRRRESCVDIPQTNAQINKKA